MNCENTFKRIVDFEMHLLFAFDRQLLLADLIGDLPWAYDLGKKRGRRKGVGSLLSTRDSFGSCCMTLSSKNAQNKASG